MSDPFIGRRVDLGIAKEGTRGTPANPTYWLPRTTLSVDDKVEKHTQEESFGVIDDSDASFVVQRWAEGDIEGEIRDQSFGLMLYAMLGSCSSAVKETTAYDHTFSLAQTNNHQSLSFLVETPIASQMFPLVMLDSLTIDVEVGGMATYNSTWISRAGDAWANQAESYTVENKFRATDLTLKLAAARANLAAASGIGVKSFSITFSKNLLRSHNLGSVEPNDIYNQQFAVEGSFSLDHQLNTYRDYMIDGSYKAMSIDLLNSGTTIGATSNPELAFILPRVDFRDWEADYGLNDISVETVNFKGMYDVANDENIVYSAVLTNEAVSY